MKRAELQSIVGPRFVVEDEAVHGSSAHRAFGRDLETGKPVFIKARTSDAYPGVRERTRDEADALREIDHPQIPSLVEADPDAEFPHIIMDRMLGSIGPIRTLEQYPDYRRAASLLIEALDALHATHEAGFSHGDVKENNLVVPHTGLAALIDFELARRLSDHFVAGEDDRAAFDPRNVRGTGPFMAPEQFTGPVYDGVRSDIYAMGITASVLAYGERPYKGADYEELIRSKVDYPEVIPWPATGREVPSALLRVIEKATLPDPLQRYEDAAAMSRDLERSLR